MLSITRNAFLCLINVASICCIPAALYQNSLEANTLINETETINEGDEAAPCLVQDILYNHGQQIERPNECDYCLCVDGDMFCYWQCATEQYSNPASAAAPVTADTTPAQVTDMENFTAVLFEKTTVYNATTSIKPEIMAESGSNVTGVVVPNNFTNKASSNNQTCVVTDTEYFEGEILPREESSCLQCICGPNGRVTCSPQNCVSLQQDHYRHGMESNSLDMFDVDIF